MTKQIFQLNIPAEHTYDNRPDLEVTVKTERFKDGKHFKTSFIDFEDVILQVKNWRAVWSIAQVRAEEIWRGNAVAITGVHETIADTLKAVSY